MRLRTVLKNAANRLADRLGGARFSGGGGAAAALIAADGRLLKLAPRAARMFAEARAAASLPVLFLPEDREAVERAVRSKAALRIEARARRPGGAVGRFEILLERRADGRSAALLIDRAADGREVERLGREIDRAKAEAADGAARLADLGHEMRTPLNAVIGFAETIERETFGPVGHENYARYAEHIRMAGRHLLDLVEAVVDLSRIEADRYALRKMAADPGVIAAEAAAIMRHTAEAAGLRLIADIAAELPECFFDPRAVRQILINLLSNAVKFTSDGEVVLSARADGENILYMVKDDGVGMSADALSKIGSRYTGARQNGVRGQGGAGLGLSLAIALAELHGGVVDLNSAPGEGVVAIVRLPIVAAPAPAKGAVRAALAAARREERPAAVSELDRIRALRTARADAA